MSKHNVNPDHYKVAGRERQGEDILQARNKQKLAQSLVRERFEMRQAVPAGTSPADPSAFPSAPSVASARQESGSSGATPPEPGEGPSLQVIPFSTTHYGRVVVIATRPS